MPDGNVYAVPDHLTAAEFARINGVKLAPRRKRPPAGLPPTEELDVGFPYCTRSRACLASCAHRCADFRIYRARVIAGNFLLLGHLRPLDRADGCGERLFACSSQVLRTVDDGLRPRLSA